tara:strand:- start:494 stop:1624 length:1131 start_codon:yes stop_codon:yes gene_type:complete
MYLAISYFVLLLIVIYIISLVIYIVGNFIPSSNNTIHRLDPISVIIAVKNGEKSLPHLLSDLKNQDYQGLTEYIIVDDGSTDNTEKIIKKFQSIDDKFRYISSEDGNEKLFFKKKALDAGIKNAHFDILLFTDVDCRLKKSWVKSMAQYFKKDIDYVIGFSEVPYLNNMVAWFQRIDFLMLLTAARATCNLKIPFASTGQNQAYRKSCYEKIGFLKLENSIQGDDTLFLQLCVQNNMHIVFNDDKKSFVSSRIEKKFLSFIKQRIRWSGDAKLMWYYNKPFFIVILSTFLINVLMLMLAYETIFLTANYINHLQIILLIKFILELGIYLTGSFQFNSTFNISLFLYWFILEIPYVLLMGIGSMFVKYISWRGGKKV